MFYLGIETGSTTRAVVVDASLHIVAQARAECSDPALIPPDTAAQRIVKVIREALMEGDCAVSHIRAAAVGLAGGDPADEAPWLRDTLAQALPGIPCVTASDLDITLMGAHEQPRGLLLLAGAGSCAYGVCADGRRCLIGQWSAGGCVEGSAYWLGRQALKCVAVLTDHKRRDDHSQWFCGQVLDFLEIRTPRQMLKWVYSDSAPAARVATLAPLVLVLAQEGNQHAVRLATQGALALVDHAYGLFAQLGQREPLVMAGALLEKSAFYRQIVAQQLGIEARTARRAPAVGAAMLAMRHHPPAVSRIDCNREHDPTGGGAA